MAFGRLVMWGVGRLGSFVAVALVGAAMLLVAPSTAQAQCVLVGSTVTCSGVEPNGFSAGAANNLTVNVQPGATVQDNAGAVNPIDLNNGNTVINRGTVTAGDNLTGINGFNANTYMNFGAINVGNNAFGMVTGDNSGVTNFGAVTGGTDTTAIFSGQNNTITNAVTGTLTLGDGGVGIYTVGGTTVNNFGGIAVGAGSFLSGGIIAINDGNTILNAAGASITTLDSNFGIFSQGNDSRVTNNGTIATGQNSLGIGSQGDRVVVINTGAITSGDQGAGINHNGNNSTVLNSGTIVTGSNASAGIAVNGDDVVVTNSGTVITGAGNFGGIAVLGDRATITNSGTITVGDNFAIGIWAFGVSPGSGNRIINTGTINVGTDGTGILVDNDAAVFNAGTINAAGGLYAIQFCNCSADSSLTLGTTSVINGLVLGTGTQVFNLGGSTGTGTFDLSLIGAGQQYDGFGTFNKIDTSHWILTGIGSQDWNVLGGLLTLNGTINGQVAVSNSTFTVNGAVNGGVSIASGVLNANGAITGNIIAGNSVLTQAAGSVIGGGVVLDNGTFTTSGTVTGAVTVSNSTLTQNTTGAINGALTLNTSTATLNGIVNNSLTANTSTLSQGTSGIFNGGVTLNDSQFAANGTVNGPVTLNGGILSGNGTVGSTTINSGSLSPGNSIGTLTVQGNLVLSSAAAYIVEVGGVAADRTNVTGTATIAGTVQASFANPLLPRYTILTANGGVLGTFGALATSNMPAAFAAQLSYDANNVYLSLTSSLGVGQGLNQNQQNVATSLNTYFNGGGALTERFGAVFALTGQNLRSALSQLSGEIATQSAQAAFSSVDYFLNLLLDPFVTGRGGAAPGAGANNFAGEDAEADAYAAKRRRSPSEQDAYAAMLRKAPARNNLLDPRWSVWGAGYGGALKADGNAVIGARDASTRAYGFAAGADYRFSPDTLAGFALSGGGTLFSLAQGAGSGRSDVFQAGAFVRHNFGQAYVKGALAYGWHDVTTERTIAVAGIDKLEGRYNANSFAARGEAGYRFVTPWMGLTPYAAAQSITYFQPGYADQVALGLNTFALNYASRDITSARTELGLRADKSFALDSALVTLRGRAAWAHYFDDNRALTASFQTLAAPAFVVTGAAQARDAALVSASADVRWMNGISLAGVFEGELSRQTRGYAGKGIVRYSW
jgi:uncharacterized protein with beta-barrel porin domain